MRQQRFTIPLSHPALAGHFPGNPVVPGALIMEQVEFFIASGYPEKQITGINQVKFMQPLLPDQEVSIELERKKTTQISFSCYVGGQQIAKGVFNIEDQ